MSKQPALLIDLDGTIYKGNQIIDGAIEFLQHIDRTNTPHLFVTNRGNRTPQTVASSLQSMGLNCSTENILTSSMATADHLSDKNTAYWIGEDGLTQALNNTGIKFNDKNPDVVIAGYDREFNYDKLTLATRLILKGAKFIATNDDHIITIEEGVIPEAGPIVAALQKATQIEPQIIGKPHAAIVNAACKRLKVTPQRSIIIGDNLSTDILTGIKHGLRSALVLTGVTKSDDPLLDNIKPTWIVKDLHEFSELLFTKLMEIEK